MEYQISDKAKKVTLGVALAGLVLMVIGFFSQKEYVFAEKVDEHSVSIQYWGKADQTKIDVLKNELISSMEAKGYSLDIHGAGHSHGAEGDHAEHHETEHEEADAHGAHHDTPTFLWDIHIAHAEGHEAHGGHHEDAAQIVVDMCESGSLAFTDTKARRFWSNILINGFFFFGIGLGALFFIALQYATESGWGVVYKRLLEGMTGWLPIGAIFLIIVFIGASMGWNHIYHWMDPDVMDPENAHFDPIIYNKQPFLSQWFFWLMNAVYFGVFLLFARGFRKRSLQEDLEGGTAIHYKNFAKGAFYLVLFGYLSSAMSWHWVMSIDTHWFSTLYGWYVFSGIWLSATIFILLLTFWLKGLGYLSFVNESHIHDMGKWMFAISFLWTYLFFSQFMLIWYANIPEEVTYYLDRFGDYKWILWTTVAVNFVVPIILLMSREAKRSKWTILIIGSILFIFHWVDVFILVMPGSVFDHWTIGWLEVGMFLTFLGLFIFTVLRTISKAPLLVKNHPYLDENLHHHT